MKVTTPTKAGTPLGSPVAGDTSGADLTVRVPPENTWPVAPAATSTEVTTIYLTANDAAMVKLFERLGALKGEASFLSLTRAAIPLQPSMIWMMTLLKAYASVG